jgi:hypothetical protein
MADPKLVVVREPTNRVVTSRTVQKVVIDTPGPQGPPGVPGAVTRYSQSFSSASTVIVVHNLNTTTPEVSIWVGNIDVDADISYGDPNTVTIAFGSPQTGRIGVI